MKFKIGDRVKSTSTGSRGTYVGKEGGKGARYIVQRDDNHIFYVMADNLVADFSGTMKIKHTEHIEPLQVSSSCVHQWEEVLLLTSSMTHCAKCGEKK